MFALWSTSCDINIATRAFFWLMLSCYTFFYPFIFSLFMSLYLKCISFGSCFFIQTDNLHLLIGIFKPFTFNMTLLWLGLSLMPWKKLFHTLYLPFEYLEDKFSFLLLHLDQMWKLFCWILITCLRFYLMLKVINALRAENALFIFLALLILLVLHN